MVKLLDAAFCKVTSTGDGDLTLGEAIEGFRTFAGAGAQDGDVIPYRIQDGAVGNYEIGLGTYNAASNSISRSVMWSTNGDGTNPIWLTNQAVVFATAFADQLTRPPLPAGLMSNVDDWVVVDDGVVPFQTGYIERGGVTFSQSADLGGTGELGSALTVPVAGLYHVSFQISWSVDTASSGDGILFELQTAGLGTDNILTNEARAIITFGSAAGDENSVSNTLLAELAEGDTVYCRVTSVGSSGATVDYGLVSAHLLEAD